MKGDALITGASGLIGGEIALTMMRSGWRVWCLVRSRSFPEAAVRLERRFALSQERCDWSKVVAVPGNITEDLLGLNSASVRCLRDNCRIIVHCAAETSFANDDRCIEVNIGGTRHVLDTCETLGQHAKLYFMSSAAVCSSPANGVIGEDSPYAGSCNAYVYSKRKSEELVLQSTVDAIVLRPSIVLSEGTHVREFARAILWVLPVIKDLGVLPMSGMEKIDAVGVRFVAEAFRKMLEGRVQHRIYHLSAGLESSVSWNELFRALTRSGHDYSEVHFDPDLNWETFGSSDPRLRRLKQLLSFYLPFMKAGTVYNNSRLKTVLGKDLPPCPKPTAYCSELLDLFTKDDAYEEALKP